MNYFTSDWHLGEDRIGINGKPNLFFRPFFSIKEQNAHIAEQLRLSDFKDGDTLYHLGDVLYSEQGDALQWLSIIRNRYPLSKFILIIGNYDEGKEQLLAEFFDEIHQELSLDIGGYPFYLNHYPSKCLPHEFSITGHIHSLWKVQANMINVGVDAWHFRPVSEETLLFCRNGIENHYDENVFLAKKP